MKDFIGNEVKVGDHIFYSTTGRYSECRYGEIIRFTPKCVVIKLLKGDRGWIKKEGEEVLVSTSFVKVSAPITAKASIDFTYIVNYLCEGDLEHLEDEITSVSNALKGQPCL